ncbi:MAG: proton-conducting transporter membrane subunit [Acidobacteriota bacterium]
MVILALLGPWIVLALVAPFRRPVGLVTSAQGALPLVSVGAALTLTWTVLKTGPVSGGWPDWFRIDPLSAFMACCVSIVGAGTMVSEALTRSARTRASATAVPATDDERAARRVATYGSLFVLAMLAAVTVGNVALMWTAIEATTIMSAILIPLRRTKASVEASWKYILIGSVGIALAFAGTVLAYVGFAGRMGRQEHALDWTLLMSVAPGLQPDLLHLAFVFLVVGYGTKAGWAPMHTWLPDAHSESPAPLSAMMSGVLLAVAQYAILRWKAVVDLASGGAFTDQVLVVFAMLSIGIGALSLVLQKNYKRLLAYSSVEHSGLVCLGLTFGPAGVFASLLHILNHALAKSASFLLAGRILRRYGSPDIERVRGLLRAMPGTGPLFAAGLLALMGFPPFGIFISEFLLFRAGFSSGHVRLTLVALLLVGIGFVALAGHLVRMLYGAVPEDVPPGETERRGLAVMVVCLLGLVALGLVLPDAVSGLISRAAEANVL